MDNEIHINGDLNANLMVTNKTLVANGENNL